ncbi:MAG: hypothetical protein AAGA21_13950 [Pseudomonadota bacterium]
MHDHHEDQAGPGHNHPPTAAQWQTPHLHSGTKAQVDDQHDADLVEESFVEGFQAASDPTSFLRLAGIAFTATDDAGRTLSLLRVQLDQATDVGSVTPHLGGRSYRYDPLPAKLVSRRRDLRFIYHDGETLRTLTFIEARQLSMSKTETGTTET